VPSLLMGGARAPLRRPVRSPQSPAGAPEAER
jgi:hypothetical protein